MFNLQDAACVAAPGLQHLPGFTQGLFNGSAFFLVFRESSTSGSCLQMWLLLLKRLLFVFYRVSGGSSSGAAQGGGR